MIKDPRLPTLASKQRLRCYFYFPPMDFIITEREKKSILITLFSIFQIEIFGQSWNTSDTMCKFPVLRYLYNSKIIFQPDRDWFVATWTPICVVSITNFYVSIHHLRYSRSFLILQHVLIISSLCTGDKKLVKIESNLTRGRFSTHH